MQESSFVIKSPLGFLKLYEENGFLTRLDFVEMGQSPPRTGLQKEAARQLDQYFYKGRRSFDLPLKLEGTDFQKRVWQALLDIAYGQTESYAGLAKKIGNPKAARAVGGANHKNPLPILVPCHRVIGAGGSLTGYGGGREKKRYLLELEARNLGKE